MKCVSYFLLKLQVGSEKWKLKNDIFLEALNNHLGDGVLVAFSYLTFFLNESKISSTGKATSHLALSLMKYERT